MKYLIQENRLIFYVSMNILFLFKGQTFKISIVTEYFKFLMKFTLSSLYIRFH